MASWGGNGSGSGSGSSLREIFEKPLPGNPSLIDSMSTTWRKKPTKHDICTELFGELHFKEPSYELSSSSSLSPRLSGSPPTSKDVNLQHEIEKLDDEKNNENETQASSDSLFGVQKNQYMKSFKSTGTGFSSKNAESLQLCTEGLGFESSDDVENSKDETRDDWKNIQKGETSITRNNYLSSYHNLNESRRLKTKAGDFPPPITCLGKNGKPLITLKAFRYDGRFILKGIKMPNREILHACREDGRLTLHRVQHDKEILEEVEYDDAYEQEDEEEADYDDAYEQEDKGLGKKSEFSNVEVEHNP